MAEMGNANSVTKEMRWPKRIILVRHGESEGNVDKNVYATVPDHRVQLTEKGKEQAKKAGELIRSVVGNCNKVYFYVSPFLRTRETLKEIGASFSSNQITGVREECRLREMDYAKFQNTEKMEYKKERERYGKFFYRFPHGESATDVYDRVSGFIETLWRDIVDMDKISHCANNNLNIVIISHGVTIRILLMRLFNWTTEQVESLISPKNGEIRIMEVGHEGEYSLALHHDDQTLQKWGLSPQIIVDQKNRAYGPMVDCDKYFNTHY